MKCNSCNTLMLLDRSETSARATTTWHRCPCCKQVRLTSELSELSNLSELDVPTQVYAQPQSSLQGERNNDRLNRFSKLARRVPA